MDKPFKFRYANKMAGVFLLLALTLFMAGIFFAARAKGWFEGKFVLRTTFDTEEGSFGLQEGSEVQVKNTPAGRVGKIVPNAHGQLETTFIMQKGFKRFCTADSVARVRKKFGFAGDSYVEIVPGKGGPIEEGAYIPCRKDEELMDTVQKMVKEFQSTATPLLEEVQGILHNVNQITSGLEQGQGAAGAMLKDKQVGQDVKDALAATAGLVEDSRVAVREITRLVQGIQKHWLFRKYVNQVDADKTDRLHAVGMLTQDETKRLKAELTADLHAAREGDDRADVARAAWSLALCEMGNAPPETIGALVEEAALAGRMGGDGQIESRLVEAEWLHRNGQPDKAMDRILAVRSSIPGNERDLRLYAEGLLAEIYLDIGQTADARTTLEGVCRLADKSDMLSLKARAARAWARVDMAEGATEAAAKEFDKAADLLRELGAFPGMAAALEAAGSAYAGARQEEAAAERYFRAGRSLLSMGNRDNAMRVLETALTLAQGNKDEAMVDQISRLTRGADDTHTEPAPVSAPSSESHAQPSP